MPGFRNGNIDIYSNQYAMCLEMSMDQSNIISRDFPPIICDIQVLKNIYNNIRWNDTWCVGLDRPYYIRTGIRTNWNRLFKGI